MRILSHATPSLVALAATAAFLACSAGGGDVPAGGAQAGSAGTGGSAIVSSGGSGGDAGGVIQTDSGSGGSFDPDSGCGYALIPSEREPGSIMIVYDASCSMDECADGNSDNCEQCSQGESKWKQAKTAMTTVLEELPNDVRMGLVLFPDTTAGGNCAEPSAPKVDIDSLDITRGSILTWVGGTTKGGTTPTQQSLQLAYSVVQQIQGSGRKGVLLVTDGAWNCGSSNKPIFDNATKNWNDYQIATIVVGIPGSASDTLSHLANVGGTDRIAGCNGGLDDPGTLFKDESCGSDPSTCCHYVVGSNVQNDLVQALKDIASKFLTSCVFKVPKGNDPSKFDPAFVNVYVDGELVYPDDTEGWSYVGGGTDAVEIHGQLCEQLLTGDKDKVEIMLGCKTVVK